MTRVDFLDPARRWQHFGGGGLILSAVVSALATAIEQDGARVVLAVIVNLVFLAAVVFLAFGSTGKNGIVGASPLRFLLVIAGAAAALQSMPGVSELSSSQNPALVAVIGLLTVGMLICAILVLSGIARVGVAVGNARWVAFQAVGVIFAALVVALILAVAIRVPDRVWMTGFGLISAAAIAWVGVTYFRNPTSDRAVVTTEAETLAE